jgi:cell division protein FtsX
MPDGALALADGRNSRSSVSRAVIKEARRRQRRRRITIAAVFVLGAAVATGFAVLGKHGHRTTTSSDKAAARSRSVTVVYLKGATSPAKIEAMLTAVRGVRGVAGATFVSKSAALSIEKRQVPGLVVLGGRNPLPAAIVVRLTDAGSPRRIRADLKGSGLLPGVAAIRPSRTGSP